MESLNLRLFYLPVVLQNCEQFTHTKKVFSCAKAFAVLVSGANNVPLKVLKIHILSRQVVLELTSLRNYLYIFASYRSCVR